MASISCFLETCAASFRVPLKKKPVAFRLAMLVTLMSSYCMHVKEWKCKPDDVARLNKRSNTGLNISLLSIISKNYKILLLQQQLLLLFESQSQIDVEFATDQKIDWDRCLHSIALLLHSIMRYSTTGKIWKTSSACTLGSSLCLYLQVSWAMDLDLTNHKSWVPR